MLRAGTVLGAALAALVWGAATGGAGPDTGQIAYSAPDGIHLAASDGSDDRLLPASSGDDGDPAWSPDGRLLAVVDSGDRETGPLVVLDVEANRRRVLRVSGETPAWSADGKRILFDQPGGYGTWRLWSIRPDGSGLRSELDGEDAFYPAVSSAGTLAFTAWNSRGENAIHLRRGVSSVELRTTTEAWLPHWSPDGQSLVFDAGPPHGRLSQTEVGVISADGSGERRLTHNSFWDGEGAFSPDGARIAYDTGRWGWLEVVVMNADGSSKRRLTRNVAGDACCPAWRP